MMRSKKLFYPSLVFMLLLSMSVRPLQAGYMYPIEIFTSNGDYYDSPDLDFSVEVSSPEQQKVDFTFYNNSLVNSCIAEIYFDSGSIFSFAGIANNEPEIVFFEQPTTPKNLPAGHTLISPFQTSTGLSFGAVSPAPKYGINQGEQLKISLNINGDISFEEITNRLSVGNIRIGEHIIALPDGSSESGINVPEPLTFCLVAAGALALLKKRGDKSCRTKFC